MKSLIKWLDTGPGFYANRTWDHATNEFLPKPGRIVLFPHLEKIFNHVFTINQETEKFPYGTVILSAPKKSGKTLWGALIGTWYADESYPGTEIYVLANDREQAEGKMMKAIKFNAEHQGMGSDIVHKYDIKYPGGSVTQVLSSHYTSAAGGQQALTLWDELWGYYTEKSQRLWEEMTLIPTEKLGLRVVVTYAGFEGESHLLWDLYSKIVLNGIRLKEEFPDLPCYTDQTGTMFAYWEHEPRLPWQTPDYYEQQMVELRTVNFRRLHLNQWGSAEDEFIPIAWWDKAVTLPGPLDYMPDSPHRQDPISVGVDVGVLRDTSAAAGVYSYREEIEGFGEVLKLGLAFHRIWKPHPKEILDLETTVEQFLRDIHKRYNIANILCDPTHFYRSITTLEKDGIPVERFNQNTGMLLASSALYDILKFGHLYVYLAPDLRKHIQFAAAKTTGTGFRITKSPDNPQPIDGAIALAMAVYDAIMRGGHDTTQEQVIRSPFSDCTAWGADSGVGEPDFIPEALRG